METGPSKNEKQLQNNLFSELENFPSNDVFAKIEIDPPTHLHIHSK